MFRKVAPELAHTQKENEPISFDRFHHRSSMGGVGNGSVTHTLRIGPDAAQHNIAADNPREGNSERQAVRQLRIAMAFP